MNSAPLAFQSRYRAASHFRRCLLGVGYGCLFEFQSRYRAASHFRLPRIVLTAAASVVSISLSSGFSFQVQKHFCLQHLPDIKFQSRYRAASHFRANAVGSVHCCETVSISLSSGFSFQAHLFHRREHAINVSISLSSGFSFQGRVDATSDPTSPGFNLVIERLLISGPPRFSKAALPWAGKVSISLSSGFSFQVNPGI